MHADFLIVGAGMAGASAAHELVAHGSVLLLEQEAQPGYHATGRSAALFSETYGNAAIRALSVASREFFSEPPDGFSEYVLWSKRPALFVGKAEQLHKLDEWCAGAQRLVPSVTRLDAVQTSQLLPRLRVDYVAGGVLEPEAADLDVDVIHQGFLRGAGRRGAETVCGAEVRAIQRRGAVWTVETQKGRYESPVLINAAGAWGDEIARMAGVSRVGLEPKRRTAIIFPAPEGVDVRSWPALIDIDERFYFKPEARKLLGSPADETPSSPCDAQPEELDVAIAADRIEGVLDFPISRVERKWAGLRSFVADRTPVVGFDPATDGFFWLVGQGGYGIQTAPAMARLATSLLVGNDLPRELRATGFDPNQVAPRAERFRDQATDTRRRASP